MTPEQLAAMCQCGDKVRHASRSDAIQHKTQLRKRGNKDNFNVYHCRHCGGYHVGHSSNQQSIKRKRRWR